jgi:hypothetical protein
MTYKRDKLGYPADLKMHKLERRLGELAGEYGEHFSPDRDEEIVREYHITMHSLYALGWDDELDFDAHLPHELMPEEYLRRNNMLDRYDWFDDYRKTSRISGEDNSHSEDLTQE